MSDIEDRAYAALETSTQDSVLTYVTQTEELFRSKAIELARSKDRVPWGRALLQAASAECNKWNDNKTLLRRPQPAAQPRNTGSFARRNFSSQRTHQTRNRPTAFNGPSSRPRPSWQGKGKSRGKSKGRGLATAKVNKDGMTFCKPYNDTRGCDRSCPFGELHACDVVLAAGRVCGRRDHTRLTHDEGRHGKAQRVE